jgi:PKD repeat protein
MVFLLLAAAATSLDQTRAGEVVYLAPGSTWRFLRGLQEASTPDTAAWREPGFNDGAWSQGPAAFGYGEAGLGTDLAALAPPMQGNYTSLFLRQVVQVPNPGAVAQLEARADYDDGFVLWINAVEVLRVNVPAGGLSNTSVASAQHESGSIETFPLPAPDSFLVPGANVVAAMVFNNNLSSSDLKFDLELVDPIGTDQTPPVVAALVPAAGITVRSLSIIEVTFSEPVAGVSAADLRVDGAPASSLSGSGAGPYVFTFPARAPGAVAVMWTPSHGITDLANPPNAFAGGAWSYTVDPDLPAADLAINELLASNSSGLADEDGERPDWIEVINRGSAAVNVGGLSLTDDPADPGKWALPDRSLGAGQFLIVFASGKDRRPASGNLHASFKLASDGEYLGLWSAESPRRVLSEVAPVYPTQRADISYGLSTGGGFAYFQTPTPGSANAAGSVLAGIVESPLFSAPRGCYAAPFSLSLSTPTPGASIRFTLDGREPTEATGTLYSEPIAVSGSPTRAVVTVRAAAFRSGFLPSVPVAHTYVFADHVPSQPDRPAGFPTTWGTAPGVDYGMDPEIVTAPSYEDRLVPALLCLPAVSIVADVADIFGPSGIYSNPTGSGDAWERASSVEMLFPNGRDGWQVNCGLRIQGGASRNPDRSPKHAFRLHFKGDYGPTRLRVKLFGDSAVADFDHLVLRADYNNSWIHWDNGQRSRAQYTRDQWVRDTLNAMGQAAGHGIYVHLYVNGLYWGLYNLVERPNAAFAASYFGGEKEEYDAMNGPDDAVDGNRAAFDALIAAANAGLSTNASYLAIQQQLDVVSLADYMLVNYFGGNDDWPNHNWYAVRRRVAGSPFHFLSWDAERIFEDVNRNRVGADADSSPARVFERLRANAEFRLLVADRVHRHFFNGGALTPERVRGTWEARAGEVIEAVVAESARWGDYRRDVHQSSNGPYLLYTPDSHWVPERNRLLNNYFPQRSGVLVNQLRAASLYPAVGAPLLSLHGGSVDPGFQLTLSLPAGTTGTIYFTTDGADPRTFASGAPSESATAYSSPLTVQKGTLVKARIQNGAVWSALTEAYFAVPVVFEPLRLTEIMYNAPAGPEYEFLELQNTGGAPIDISGLRFVEGIDYSFPEGSVLAPGGFWVLAADAGAFASFYGAPADGQYDGSLDGGGEDLVLADPAGNVVLSLRYDDEGFWPLAPDGFGFSLVLREAFAAPRGPLDWRASSDFLGSPGNADPAPIHDGVLVSEVLSASAAPLEDAIELHNPTAAPVDASGWFLSDSAAGIAALRKFRIPDGTVIPAGGHAVFYEYQFNAVPGSPSSFALDSAGDDVFLTSADPLTGDLTGYLVGVELPPSEPGVSYGLTFTSAGPDYAPLSARTFGMDSPATVAQFRMGLGVPNAPPLVGPVVLNEVQYRPGDEGHPAVGGIEFVELHNLSQAPAALHDAALGRGWQLGGLLNAQGTGRFELPVGAEVEPLGYGLVVPVDPALFRQRRGIPAGVPIWGPCGGALDNGGERLELLMPIALEGGEVRHVLADHVAYDDELPWPLAADGGGPSLERREPEEYGNDPANWGASMAAGGTPGQPNSVGPPPQNRPPVASFTFSPQAGAAPLSVRFDASSSSDPDGVIVSYAWDFADGVLGTGRIVTHTFQSAGSYDVTLTVEDDGGLERSSTRRIVASDPAANEPPVASFTAAPQVGDPPLEVAFNASASSDPDGTIASYGWDFGDGGSGSGRILNHTYTRTGSFRVLLVVADDRGATGMAERTVVVGSVPNEPPVASFTVTPSSGPAPLAVVVDGSASSDPDGVIASYNWDFGDGGSGSGRVVGHTYESEGNYVVLLIVTDDRNAVASTTRTVTVGGVGPGGRQRPGDCNQDGGLDISDAVCLLGHLFLGRPAELPCAGGRVTDPGNRALLNANGDAGVDLTDAVFVLLYLFRGGAPPVLGVACTPIEGCADACAP